ncbi:hypothetical protein PINS_up014773 [Pythium insidiosum]|nr:hypothetical protein PINS_up014773 [Pythium insidiosum]
MPDKRLSIPADVPVGGVIGRRGSQHQALQTVHGVRAIIDSRQREIVVRGAEKNVTEAINDVLELFETLALSSKRIRRCGVGNGKLKQWRFEETQDSKRTQFVLQGTECEVSNQTEASIDCDAWIVEFNEEFVERMVKELDDLGESMTASSPPLKAKISLGFLAFILRSPHDRMSKSYSFKELQELTIGRDIVPMWNCSMTQQSETVHALVERLEKRVVDKELAWVSVLSVYVKEKTTGRQYGIKYRLEGNEWKPFRHGRRLVHATYDVVLDEQRAFRVRTTSRAPTAPQTARALEKCVFVKLPAKGDVFGTKINVESSRQRRFELDDYSIRRKVHVEWHDLRFTLSHMSEGGAQVRLECRLSNASDGDTKGSLAETTEKSVRRVLDILNTETKELSAI